MTKEQYDRWRDFATRMVRVAVLARQRKPSRKWVAERVADFLDRFAVDHAWVVDWDTFPNRGLHPSGIDYGVGVGDEMSNYEWDHLPQYVLDLEHDGHIAEFEDARDRWFGPVRCCVRAGLDVASSPSAGVVGFTVGDLRVMYPKGVPEWIAAFFKGRRGAAMTPREFARLPDDRAVWL